MGYAKGHASRLNDNGVDRFRHRYFRELYLNVRPARRDEAQLIGFLVALRFPSKLCRQPAREQNSRRPKPFSVADAHAFDLAEVMMRRRMIEELGDGHPDLIQAR